MAKMIMILTTSEIQEVEKSADGAYQTKKHEWLQQAIQQGFKVLVASTRLGLAPTDDWWVKIVGEEAVFFADGPDYTNDRPMNFSAGWQKALHFLGIHYPENEHGEPVHWTEAREILRKEQPRQVFFKDDLHNPGYVGGYIG